MLEIFYNMLDFYFHYLHISRFIINNRVAFSNTHCVPYLAKLVLFFSLLNLTIVEDTSIYNYFYLFRFYLGRKAFIINYRSFFSLRNTYYSFDICISLRKQALFFPIAFYVNDLHRFLSLKGYHSYFINSFCYALIIKDTNLFTERKTNLGLYNLKHVLNYRFYITNGDFISSKLFLDTLKLLIFNE